MPEGLPRGIITSPNHEARLVEAVTGHQFVHEPVNVDLTTWNKMFIFLNPYLRNTLGLRFRDIFTKPMIELSGAWIPRYGATFLKNSKNKDEVIFHENGHAVTGEINPELLDRKKESLLKDYLGSPLWKKLGYPHLEEVKTIDNEQLNIFRRKFWMKKVVAEGIAEWVMVEAFARSNGIYSRDRIDGLHVSWMQRQAADLEKRPEIDAYLRGHAFVYQVLDLARKQGLSQAEVLRKLIKNPPEVSMELEYPADYLGLLLKAA